MPTGRRCCAIPRSSTPISATIWKPRTTTPKACSATPRPCRRSWSRKCAGGSRRTIPACRRRTALTPISANSARAASTNCSAACRATAATTRSCSTATRSRPDHDYFKFGGARHSPDHKLAGLERRHQGFGIFLDPGARLGRRHRPRRSRRGDRRRRGLEHGLQQLLLRQARRQPSPDAGLASSPRHQAGGRCAGL